MQRYKVYLYLEIALHVSGGRVGTAVPTLPLQRQVAVPVWQVPDAVDTVVCAPDDERRHHPKHVGQFPDINKLCNITNFYIYIGIYLRCTDPWTLKETMCYDSMLLVNGGLWCQ